MIKDVPNDFWQTSVPQNEGDKITIMKIQEALVDILCDIRPEIHEPYLRFNNKNREKILYVHILKALYRMIIASLLYYKKFRKDIESIGFEVNQYDKCVANRTVNEKNTQLNGMLVI